MAQTVADYVIVGAGSAGCVLANRLSEDAGATVAVIEAGGSNRSLKVTIPVAFSDQFQHKKLDWNFSSEPEPQCGGRSLYLPRGKSVGGSSSMNAMLYVRGRPLDYDLWDTPGWAWDDVRPYFLKAENNERGESEFHAVGGPLNVADQRAPNEWTERFFAAAEAAGIPRNADYNGGEQDGTSIAQVTQKGGRRWSCADAYLAPARSRKNVSVITGATVSKVEIAGGRARGVRYRDKRGREHLIAADREVILAAGAYGSPQLLLLSGVGPGAQLREHGIDVVAESGEVGENLQDHPYLTCIWEVPEGTLADAEKLRYLGQWIARRQGPLTSPVAEGFAFVRSRPGLPAADLQFHFAPAYFNDNGFDESFDGHAITSGPVVVSTKSRGWVRLRSADPAAKPRILTNTLAEREDVDALVAGVKLAREIVAEEPIGSRVVREIFPGAGVQSDDDIVADLRKRVELLYHPVGTCRMGADDGSVVDPELCVRGVDALRVIDASVMPVIPGGNTNAPTIMIAERASDLIRNRGATPA